MDTKGPRSVIWLNGSIVERAAAVVSVFDHGLLYGDGVFEGIRFYDGRPFRLRPHLERLERSAAALSLRIPYEREDLTAATEAVIRAFGAPDGYIRLVVTRGEGDLGLDPRSCARATVFLAAAPVRVFPHGADGGVDVIIASTRQSPADVVDARIKSLNYLGRILARIEANRAGAAEAILLDHRGHLAEGTADNLFIVRDGRLVTPPAIDGALEGITRATVMELARGLGLSVEERSLARYDLVTADEAFLVGTGAGLVPIRGVDGTTLGACPGPFFRRIHSAYEALVRSEGGV